MAIYNIHEAITHFFKLIEQVLQGENIVIAKAGKPVAHILPFVVEDLSPRVPGIDKGKVIILPDFDEPLPEFDL